MSGVDNRRVFGPGVRTGALLLFLMSLIVMSVAPAGADDECIDCHGDPDFSIEDDAGNDLILFVDADSFTASIHGDMECAECHVMADSLSHPDDRFARVDCGSCHDDVVEDFAGSIHARASADGADRGPGCADCHGKHDIRASNDAASPAHPRGVAVMCGGCHADPEVARGIVTHIQDPVGHYAQSVHGLAVSSGVDLNAATCVSCHGSHDIRTMADSASSIHWLNVPGTCGDCHADIHEAYTGSVHWQAAVRGQREAPVCTDCHGEHDVRSPDDRTSPVHRSRVSAVTCERCHASELITERYGMTGANVKTYEDSFHGLAVKGGSLSAANCASCHGVHNILPSSDPQSTIHPDNLTATCAGCHKDATVNFGAGSIHLTTGSKPGAVVEIVRKIYLWLIVAVIGGMLLHNGIDLVHKSRIRLRGRKAERGL